MNIIKFMIATFLIVASIVLSPLANAQTGVASYYGGFFHGRLTASGVTFNKNAMTAAHRTLPFGTKVRVTAKSTGKSVEVVINDRGPFVGNRVIDLSEGAASRLGIIKRGVDTVNIEIIGKASLGPQAYQNRRKATQKKAVKKFVPKHVQKIKPKKPVKVKVITKPKVVPKPRKTYKK